MNNVREMFDTHPNKKGYDIPSLDTCIYNCFDCADYCIVCADACLEEENVKDLRKCIRLNQECAIVCEATGNLLLKATTGDWGVITKQLELCEMSCRMCGEECNRHASMHEHCRVCAEMCNQCVESCRKLINDVSAKYMR